MNNQFRHYILTVGLGVLGCTVTVLPAKAAFRFIAWGDATDLLDYVVTNAAQIRQLSVQPNFSLFVGDLYDTGFSLTAVNALQNAMDGPDHFRLSGTLFPVRGNHDIIGSTNATLGWQAYFDVAKRVSGGDPTKGVPGIGGSNYTSMAGMDGLSYSFDYQNCHFATLDIPGDVTLVKSDQLIWLDADLAAAEKRRVQHTFLFWHGPVYSCGDRHGGISAPASMIAVLNKHPSVSAIFGGHAHVFAWTHMYTNRLSTITHPFEAFIVPPVAENLAGLSDTNRCDYGLGNIRGFMTVDVDGPFFTVSCYLQDEPIPRFTKCFPGPATLSSPMIQLNGQFQFKLIGEWGRRYLVETSSNFTDWRVIQTNTATSLNGVLITEPRSPNTPQQFYRCLSSP